MSALGGGAAGGEGINPTASLIALVIVLVAVAVVFVVYPAALVPLIGVIIGGVLISFGVHFVPVLPQLWDRHRVLQPVWLCLQPVVALQVSSEAHGQLNSGSQSLWPQVQSAVDF